MRLTGFGVVMSAADELAAEESEAEARLVLLPLIDDDDEVRLDCVKFVELLVAAPAADAVPAAAVVAEAADAVVVVDGFLMPPSF